MGAKLTQPSLPLRIVSRMFTTIHLASIKELMEEPRRRQKNVVKRTRQSR